MDDNKLKVPKIFTTFCKIAEFSDEKIEESWFGIWQKTSKDFLDWLISEAFLTEEQKTRLSKNSEGSTSPSRTIFDLTNGILTEDEESLAADHFSTILLSNLDNFYSDVKSKMTFDQKQVLTSYLKTS